MTKMQVQLFLTAATVFVGLLFLLASVPALASTDCDGLKGCERKFCEIEKKLKNAREEGNKHKANGLSKSLKQAKAHCTDRGLRDDLVGEIEEAKEDIAEYEADLKEAEEHGKTDKVLKYQQKIKEEKREIKHLEEVERNEFDAA